MRFLRRLFDALRGFKSRETDILASAVADAELLARYIYESNKFNKQNLIPKPQAFMPERYDGKYETSICREKDLDDTAVWAIGDTVRADGVVAKARADFKAESVRVTGLEVVADPSTYPQHALIINWPEEKDKRLMHATELANAAQLVLSPTKT